MTAARQRRQAAEKRKRRRSRIRLGLILVTAIVVPIAVTVLFMGNERAQDLAAVALAVWLIALASLALFQRPIPKSQSSWGDAPKDPPESYPYGTP